MNKFFRATSLSILAAAVAGAGFLACSSTSNTTNDGGTTGDGGGDGNPANGDGAVGEGGDGGGTTARNVGRLAISQGNFSGSYNYDVSATFARLKLGTMTPTPCPSMVNVTMGSCSASKICVPAATDAGPQMIQSGLNAGDITVANAMGDAGAAVLTYGPIMAGSMTYNGYKPVSADVQFFAGGDMITAMGAGGADLPAFAAQTVIAPSDITLTTPDCTSGCPAVDRTADLAVAWTGGGVGKVFFTYETVSDNFVGIVTCDFNAAAGTGTVPAALLAHLEKAGDPGISGVYAIGVTNESPTFMVSDIPTTFEVQGGGTSGTLTISN